MNKGLPLVVVGTALCAGLLAAGYFIGKQALPEGTAPQSRTTSPASEAAGGRVADVARTSRPPPTASDDPVDESEAAVPATPSRSPAAEARGECPVCPAAAPCEVCRACPTAEAVCRPYRAESASLAESVRRLEMEKGELEDRLNERGPKRKYPAETAQERRVMAATQNSLLMEFPSWGEDLVMQDAWVKNLELTPEERQGIETLYQEFRSKLYEELRTMYADMVGDPDAGANETLNALIHNIQGLSPRELCQERILAILAVIAAGGPLPQPSPDAPACERVVLMIFGSVDELDAKSVAMFGEKGKKALWSGTSSFETSTGSSDKPTER